MANSTTSVVTKADGTLDFSGGVNSLKVTTIQSQQNPNGLARNELAWLDNASVRDGGITPRWGWQKVGTVHDGSGIFQGAFMYEPQDANPYPMFSVGGHIYQTNPDNGATVDITAAFVLNTPQFNPADQPTSYFRQAEQFLVIQAGDGVTLPFFWDGALLRRSIGITNPAASPGTPGQNEIPAATTMDYYMGRLWYAQGRQYSAGDIVGGPSGTAAYNYRDSVLNVTENPLVVGGDGFTIPASSGIIRALRHSANIDAALGQGRLFIFTRNGVFSLQVPVTRTDWIGADNSNQPLQTVVQLVNGSVNDRSVVTVNGDLFYQSLEPGIRSLFQSIRYFNQWGNIQISSNEQRILQFNDRSLLYAASGIYFDNRMLQTALPRLTTQGVVHPALIPLDFIPISSFNRQKEPVWEGMYEGLNFFQLLTGDFGGRERAFGFVRNNDDGSIELWELTQGIKVDGGDNRVTWIVETPAFTWGNEFQLKKLVSLELWIDRMTGTVVFGVEWRPDGASCWIPWMAWKECSPKNSAETVINPIAYPLTEFPPCYKATMTLPRPPERCAPCNAARPAHLGYQHQFRLTIHGYCRLRGLMAHAEFVDRQLYQGLVCNIEPESQLTEISSI